MAYEHMTYELILQEMISRISAKYPNLDTREGSIIFNACAPAALELAIAYAELDNVLSESFVGTASREYLFAHCNQMGMDVSVFNASAGVHKGVFDVEVPIGSRWNYDLYNYTVTEYIGKDDDGRFTYRMQCETTGTTPNNVTGKLTPITEVPQGLDYSEVTECLISGENEYTDDEIRVAYFDYVRSMAIDGNVAQYEKWCSTYPGIGHYKVFPLYNNQPNTVRVSILRAPDNRKAGDTLINDFQEYLDPGIKGMGNGVAPIGAFVTVSTAAEIPITVGGKVTLAPNRSVTTEELDKAIEDYFTEIAYKKKVVSYMGVGAALLKVDGVEFVSDLTLGGQQNDIDLQDEEIPVLNRSNGWTVITQ